MLRAAVFGFPLLACLGMVSVHADSVINFDDLNFGNYDQITSGYGDNLVGTPNVTVSYTTWFDNGLVDTNNLLLWNAGYGGLSKVAFASSNDRIAEVRLDAAAGYEVELQSFQLAAYGQASLGATLIRVLNGDGDELWSSSNLLVDGTFDGFNIYLLGLTASTLRIQWGTNWNLGIDNIVFDQAVATAVPEPAGVAMLAIGGVAAAFVARRKRA